MRRRPSCGRARWSSGTGTTVTSFAGPRSRSRSRRSRCWSRPKRGPSTWTSRPGRPAPRSGTCSRTRPAFRSPAARRSRSRGNGGSTPIRASRWWPSTWPSARRCLSRITCRGRARAARDGRRATGPPAADLFGTLADLSCSRKNCSGRARAPETLDEATAVAFPGLAGVLPDFGRFDPNDWGLGFELRTQRSPTGPAAQLGPHLRPLRRLRHVPVGRPRPSAGAGVPHRPRLRPNGRRRPGRRYPTPSWRRRYKAAPVPIRLVPERTQFFELYGEAAANVVAIAELLVKLLDRFPEHDSLSRDINDLEHRGDRLTHEVIRLLNQTFVTPLDREDIYALATGSTTSATTSTRPPPGPATASHAIPPAGDRAGGRHPAGLRALQARDRGPRRLPATIHELDEVHTLENEGDRLTATRSTELFLERGRARGDPLEGHPRAARGRGGRLREGRPRARGASSRTVERGHSPRHGRRRRAGFDFTNGFHDTANAVATSVSTRALSPRLAVLIAAIMNFVGALVDRGGQDDQEGDPARASPPRRSCWRRCSGPSPGTWSPGGSGLPSPPRTR